MVGSEDRLCFGALTHSSRFLGVCSSRASGYFALLGVPKSQYWRENPTLLPGDAVSGRPVCCTIVAVFANIRFPFYTEQTIDNKQPVDLYFSISSLTPSYGHPRYLCIFPFFLLLSSFSIPLSTASHSLASCVRKADDTTLLLLFCDAYFLRFKERGRSQGCNKID